MLDVPSFTTQPVNPSKNEKRKKEKKKGHQTGMARFILQQTLMVAQYISVHPSAHLSIQYLLDPYHVSGATLSASKWKFTALWYLSVTSVSNKDPVLVSFHSIT